MGYDTVVTPMENMVMYPTINESTKKWTYFSDSTKKVKLHNKMHYKVRYFKHLFLKTQNYISQKV